jgi:hypothetical protein
MAALFERAGIPMLVIEGIHSACKPPVPSQPGDGVTSIYWWIRGTCPMPYSCLRTMVLYGSRECSPLTSTASGALQPMGRL